MNAGISSGWVEPSASIITMMSPLAAAKPVRSAAPLPLPCWGTMRIEGSTARATATVLSVEWPSTRMTSNTSVGMRAARSAGSAPR